MSNVVGFPSKDTSGPHLEGPVRCIRCKHEWRAVSPAGVFDGLECPSCEQETGVRYVLTGPEDEYWECACGARLFVLTRTGAPICCSCGLRATSWADA